MKKVLFFIVTLGMFQSVYAHSVYEDVKFNDNFCDAEHAQQNESSTRTKYVLNSNNPTVVAYANGGGFEGDENWACIIKRLNKSGNDLYPHITVVLMHNTTKKGTFHIYSNQGHRGPYVTTGIIDSSF